MPPRETIKRALDYSPLDVIRFAKRNLRPKTSNATRLTADQSALLELMRADNTQSEAPYRASAHWEYVADLFQETFDSEGLHNPENQSYNLRFSGFAANDPRLHRYLCWMYYQRLRERDRLGLLSRLSATCTIGKGHAYKIDGRLISLDLLFSIDDFYSLCELNPRVADSPVIVGELGAGWGRLGNVLCQANPCATYVIFDLPEALFISQSYLPGTLPNRVSCGYDVARRMATICRDMLHTANLWFFGAHHIDRLAPGTIDIIANIGSFQEMPPAYIQKYASSFSRIAAGGSCFLRQLRSNASHGINLDEVESFDAYPLPANWRRRFLRPSIMSDEFVEAGYQIPDSGSDA
jgi:putative sugar O-methyltransferase